MTNEEFENYYNVRIVCKHDLRLMRALGWVLKILPPFRHGEFMSRWWTTYRLPFGRPIIAYPYGTMPMSVQKGWIRQHELVHANDMRSTWGLFKMFWLVWLLPLPALFSGRWFIERYAYLQDIVFGVRTIEEATQSLWHNYGWCWPRPLMRRWFMRKLEEVVGLKL